MYEYCVTIDTMNEQYEYWVQAVSPHDAEEEALALAEEDGMDPLRWRSVNVRSMS